MTTPHKNVELNAPQGTIYRQATITIYDASDTVLNLNTFSISSGAWNPSQMPTSGQQITSGQQPNFNNYTDQPFTGIGGLMSLSPMSGGIITLSWNWKYGSPFEFSASTSNTPLAVKGQIVGQSGTAVTVQFQVTNAQ